MVTRTLYNPLPAAETDMAVPTDYIDQSYIKVWRRSHAVGLTQTTFGGTQLVFGVDYSWLNDGTIRLAVPADGLTDYLVARQTPALPLVEQQPGVFSSAKANLAVNQALNLAEEAGDQVVGTSDLALRTELATTGAGKGGELMALLDGSIPPGYRFNNAQGMANTRKQDFKTARDYGAIGDGTLHTLAEWLPPSANPRYPNFAALQADFPHAQFTTEAIDKIAIQALFDDVVYARSLSNLGTGQVANLGAGNFVSDNTIHACRGVGLASIHIRGEGPQFVAAPAFSGTSIKFLNTTGPGLAVQGVRHASIKGLTLLGPNRDWITNNALGSFGAVLDDLLEATWVDPALPAAASSQFAPLAAIAFDPYCGPKPGTAYPDPFYPPWMGTVAPYNKAPSGGLTCEDVHIVGWVAAYAIKPCNADGNAEYVRIIRPYITECVYAFSLGHTQSRLLTVTDGAIALVHTVMATTKHGLRTGKPSISIDGTEMGACIKWFDVPNMPLGGGFSIENCYGEQCYMLGNAGASASGNGFVGISDCEVSFDSQAGKGIPRYILEWNGANGGFVLERLRLSQSPSGHYGLLSQSDGADYSLNEVRTYSQVTQRYEMMSINSTGGISCSRMGTNWRACTIDPLLRYNVDTGVGDANNTTIGFTNIGPRTTRLSPYTRLARASAAPRDPGHPVRIVPGTAGKSTGISVSGIDVTFTTGLAGLPWAILQRGMGVGSTVWDSETGITFRVRSRTDGAIIMRAVTGINKAGTGLLQNPTTAGTLYFLPGQLYTPTLPVLADITHNNAVATNVTQGGAGASTFIDTDIAVGDYVYFTPNGADFVGGENRIQVSARDGTARTLTVNGEWQAAGVRRRVSLFIGAEAANA